VVRKCNYSLNHGHQQSEKKGEKLKTEKDREFGTEKKDGIQKVYELGKYDGVDVARILRHNGRLFTYRSIDHESWPPSMKEIVRLYHSNIRIHTKVKAASFVPCSQEHASSRYGNSAFRA
jgi:hypothetical protein